MLARRASGQEGSLLAQTIVLIREALMSWLCSRQLVLLLLCGLVLAVPHGMAAQDSELASPAPGDVNPLTLKWEPPSDQPLDRERFLKLSRARDLIQDGSPDNVPWDDVLDSLQSLLESKDGDSYLQLAEPKPAGLVTPAQRTTPLFSMKRTVEQIIRFLPPVGRRAYEQFYGGKARAQLRQALRTGNLVDLEAVSQHYFHTVAGSEATLRLGMAALDQQRPFNALHSFQRLRNESSQRTKWEPRLTLSTIAAWLAIGRDNEAKAAVAELETLLQKNPQLRSSLPAFATQSPEKMLAALRAALPPRRDEGTTPRDWTHYLAAPSRSSRTDRVNPVAVALWESSTTGFEEKPSRELLDRYSPLQIERDNDFPVPENRMMMAAAVKADLAFLNAEAEQLRNWPIPATHPLVTRDRVIFHTLKGIRCVDIATGKVMWETANEDPAWADLFDLKASQALSIRLPRDPIWSPMNRFQHALIKLRTQVDRTTGTLTTDGERVYFLTETGIPDRMISITTRESVRAAPNRWNTLCAADIDTGEIVWELGGPRGERELPFTGTYFLGAPIHVDGSLYVLAEEDASVRLVCLDPATGKKSWWQTIARPISSIEHEALRRVGGDSPTLADGLLLCQTTSGIITAYDPAMRRFVWTQRYKSEVRPTRQSTRIAMGMPATINTGLLNSSDRWRESTVLASGGRVVFSPLDSNQLICLDLLTGKILWKQPRGNGLYVACLTPEHVIVVEPEGVHGILIDSGKIDWYTPLEGRVPTGRGIHDGENYHLPVLVYTGEDAAHPLVARPSRGAILTIELSTGRVLAGTTVSRGQRIGNLAAAHGVLVSQQAGSVFAFESFDAVEQRIADRLKLNPNDATALAMRGRMRLHHGRTEDGLNDLAQSIQLESATEVQRDYVEAVLEELRNARISSDQAVARLGNVPLGSEYQLVLDRVNAESLEREGQIVAAFDAYLALARRLDWRKTKETHAAEGVSMSLPRWIGSRLARLHARAGTNPETVATLEKRIADATKPEPLKEDSSKPTPDEEAERQVAALRFWVELFGWHRNVNSVRVELAAKLDPTLKTVEVEQLLAAASHGEGELAWTSARQLLQHWMGQSKPATALAALANLETRFGARAASHTALLRERPALREVAAEMDWPATEPTAESKQRFTRHFERFPIPVIGNRSPAIDGWSFEVNLTVGMLVARDSLGRDLWGVRLTEEGGRMAGVHPGTLSLLSSGHCLVAGVGSRFIVFDISRDEPVELWRESFSDGDHRPVFLMAQRGKLGVYRLTDGNGQSIGSLDLVTSEHVVFRKRSTLFVRRLSDGRTVWQRSSVPSEATVLGDDRRLMLLEPGHQNGEIIDLYDGHPIATPHFPVGGATQLVGSVGADPVMWVSQNFTRVLARFNALTGQPVWQHEYSQQAMFRAIDNRLLAVLDSDGKTHFRNIVTGKAVIDTKADPFERRLIAMHVLPTKDGFIVFKAVAPQNPQIFPAPLSALGSTQLRIGGSAFAVSRATGTVIWTREMPNLLLSLDQARDLPIFVLACEKRRITPTRFGTEGFQVEVINSRTGKTLFKQDVTQQTRAYRNSVAPKGQEIDVAFDRMTVTLDYARSKPDEPDK